MIKVELSIDENNYAAAIRDAILDAEPESCRGCKHAFEHSYEIGQFARANNMEPDSAAELAWGWMMSSCCSEIAIELLQPEHLPSDSMQKLLIPT